MASRNLTEGALNKVQVSFRIDRTLKYKVLAKFGKPGLTVRDAMEACCEYANTGVALTKDMLDKIVAEEAEAYKKRMHNRLQRDIRKGYVT